MGSLWSPSLQGEPGKPCPAEPQGAGCALPHASEEQGMLPCPSGHREMVLSCSLLQNSFTASPVPLSFVGSLWMPQILVASCVFLWPSTNNSIAPLHPAMQTPCTHILERPVPTQAPLISAFGGVRHGLCFLEPLHFQAELEMPASRGDGPGILRIQIEGAGIT